jgi:hypothetical protein
MAPPSTPFAWLARFSELVHFFGVHSMRPAPISRRRLLLSACSAFALLGALPAQALGRLADVQIIDRDSGEVMAVYRHRGEHWVAGRPGARYAVALRSMSAGRTLNLVSVDGINAISGETAALNQTGYVLGPWQSSATHSITTRAPASSTRRAAERC